MVLVKSVKILVFAALMMPIAFASLSAGILFASYNLAASNNPDEADALFSQTLIFFALIETFVFIAVGVAVATHLLIK